jgi:hypothetical protein
MDKQTFDSDNDFQATDETFSHFSHEGYDERHHCPAQVPPSYASIENLTIDSALMNATPHWMFLAAGKTERDDLLSYIRHANVSAQKKNSWILFMMKTWMKYPVKYIKLDNGAKLVSGTHGRFSLNTQENKTFREIENYIAEDMSNVQTGMIVPMWATGKDETHQKFMSVPLNDRKDIPNVLIKAAVSSADVPDTWCTGSPIPFCQQINHGFVPVLILPSQIVGVGQAPDNFGIYAGKAKQDFISHDYQGAFTNMGYASHFISDLGEPFHTPNVQLIPLQFIDTPFSEIVFPNSEMVVNYLALHNAHENMVADNWGMFYDGNTVRYDINDPMYSAKVHAVASWVLNYPLVYACYWEFIKNPTNPGYLSNTAIVSLTRNRVSETIKQNRGLVQYVTGGQPPILIISASTGTGGSITPAGQISVKYGDSQMFTIAASSGYILDQILVDGNPVTQNPYTFSDVTTDHTISATFKQNLPSVIPLCPAGIPFDTTKYPQNWPQSDPMAFQCNWDGNGRVYISGSPSVLTGVRADDGFTITIQPSGATFDAQPHFACAHNILELTSGMRPGLNTFTLVVKNWMGLSMSYGSSTGIGTDQTPYIIQVNSPTMAPAAEKLSTEELPSFISIDKNGLVVNGTLVETTNESGS